MSGKCSNCGACKECGAGGRPVSPYPYPAYPYQPYLPAWWGVNPLQQWYSPQITSGGMTQSSWTSSGFAA